MGIFIFILLLVTIPLGALLMGVHVGNTTARWTPVPALLAGSALALGLLFYPAEEGEPSQGLVIYALIGGPLLLWPLTVGMFFGTLFSKR